MCETAGIGGGARSELRALAFSVFTGARRLLAHAPAGKSLTGFGTAAQAHLLLDAMDVSAKGLLGNVPSHPRVILVSRQDGKTRQGFQYRTAAC